MKHIFIDPSIGGFANQLYPIACALTLQKTYPDIFNKPLFKIHTREFESCKKLLRKYYSDCINFDRTDFNNNWDMYSPEGIHDISTNNTAINLNSHIRFIGYCQNNKLIDEKIIQQYLGIPQEIKQQIFDLYGDISDYICLHVRRGDYLSNEYKNLYHVLTKEYIERIINKYFSNEKIICISDDIQWCKENLSDISNIIFADKSTETIIDFYLQTLTKGNIISGSTFSTMGVLLNPNPNKICVAFEPMYKYDEFNNTLHICPEYSIREPLYTIKNGTS